MKSPVPEERVDLVDVKARHASLYQKAQDSSEELRHDISKRDQFIPEINRFIADMRHISSQMADSKNYADYDWLERTATKWQEIFSGILVIPRNIRKEIDLPSRPPEILISRERAKIPYQIRSEIALLACHIGENRKLADLLRRIEELNREAADLLWRTQELDRNRSRIHREIPSSPEEERQDWHSATVHIAASVLAGGPDLAYQLGVNTYWQLEQVFLDEVKRLNAYYIWQKKGDGWGLSEMEGDYRHTCDELRQMLLNPNIKAPVADFKDVREYLIKHYQIDKGFPVICRGSEAAEELERRKAQRIWESKSRPAQSQKQEKEDGELAKEYIELFYDNVIPAVEGQPESMEKVLQAFRDPWRQYGVINCFEAAIAIYFFDPDLVRKCCKDKNDII